MPVQLLHSLLAGFRRFLQDLHLLLLLGLLQGHLRRGALVQPALLLLVPLLLAARDLLRDLGFVFRLLFPLVGPQDASAAL